VERLADRVLVLVSGRLAAAGNHRAIRDAMDDRPRHVLVRADDARRLAADLPNSRLEWIDDARTFSAEDQPERLAELIAGFVREPVAA